MRAPSPGPIAVMALLCGCGEAPTPTRGPTADPPSSTTTTSSPGTVPPVLTEEPTFASPEGTEAYGVLELHVRTDVPTTLTLHITDLCGRRTLTYEGSATEHRVPVAGLHIGEKHQIELEIVSEGGTLVRTWEDALVPMPEDLPGLEVHAHDPDRLEPGLLVVSPMSPLRTSWVLAYDERMHLVYALEREVEDLRWEGGTILALHDGRGVRWDLFGREVEAWEGEIFLNHEIFPLPDGGVLALDHEWVEEPEYPVDADASETASSTVLSQAVVRYDADYQEVERLSLADVLDTTHVGFNSVGGDPLDWSHANAVVPWGDDAYVVSVRHLDVVACIGRDGRLRWLLGDPTGWQEPWASAFLEPEGALTWFRHQHAVEVTDDGLLMMFDNGNFGGSPSSPPDPDYVEVSRGVAWAIDEDAGTVREAWSVGYRDLFSFAMGDIDVLPSGQVLLTYSSSGTLPLQSRLVQLDLDDPDNAALDVEFTDGNRYTYRAEVVPGFGLDGVDDSRW